MREAAASTFDVLLGALGPQAMEEVLAPLIALMVGSVPGPGGCWTQKSWALKQEDPEKGEAAMEGLAAVVALKGKDVLPFLIPRVRPISPSEGLTF